MFKGSTSAKLKGFTICGESTLDALMHPSFTQNLRRNWTCVQIRREDHNCEGIKTSGNKPVMAL